MVKVIKTLFPAGTIYNAPSKTVLSSDWIARCPGTGAQQISICTSLKREEPAPEIFNYPVSARFRKYYNRQVPGAYVLELPSGMVYGEDTNFIITPDGLLLTDVSREFGRYGGKDMRESSLIQQKLRLPASAFVKGKMAVLSTCGWRNFHHWNYDVVPRIQLLKKAGLFDKIDHFLINHSSQSFQLEALQLAGIPPEKIINQAGSGKNFIQADVLYVPSLPSPLGTVSPWVIDFLRNLYNPQQEKTLLYKRIYLSRKKVTTRKIVNNDAFLQLLKAFSIIEVFPEDYSVGELARILADVDFIISVHGSGLSNLCFISDNTTVIDILAPYHQDGYYWMISNIRHSKYTGFFGEGEHPSDDIDLVQKKIDDNIVLDLVKMQELLASKLL